MLFAAPELGERDLAVIEDINDLTEKLRTRFAGSPRWYVPLHRAELARVVHGSCSVEGHSAAVDDAAAISLGEGPLGTGEETRRAIKGYSDAMAYVAQMSTEPRLWYCQRLLKSLHFMMTGFDMAGRPGLWRAGASYVRQHDTGAVTYEGADVDNVPPLMDELLSSLNTDNEPPPVVRAAMAHLNLVMVRPFVTGNGRVARCLQSLVLARLGALPPVFCSIDEYLGRNTPTYYQVLHQASHGSWRPDGDATPWLSFVLRACRRQARTLHMRTRETERLWDELEGLVGRAGLPERAVPVLYEAALRYRVRNVTYRAVLAGTQDAITDQVASRDLKLLTTAGLLAAHGATRARFYTATRQLVALRARTMTG